MKVQFGSGDNILAGWVNTDVDKPSWHPSIPIDICQPLPYKDNSVRLIFCEHVIEHITHGEAVKFLKEAYRVLQPKGVIRLAFPDVERISRCSQSYIQELQKVGMSDGTLLTCIENIIHNHEHKAFWTASIMKTILNAVGFFTIDASLGKSEYFPELRGLECKGQTNNGINNFINFIETSVVEGMK